MLDGRHTGTGGGNHVTLGGATPADSPFLRRPDLLRSPHHLLAAPPVAVVPVLRALHRPHQSQAPRVDEARHAAALRARDRSFAEIERARARRRGSSTARCGSFSTDLTGNTHRAEFCIDKLYSPDAPSGRQGLVELRAFEMPPHARMSLAQMLLLRALVARFWTAAVPAAARAAGARSSHDRFMLPHYVRRDFRATCSRISTRAGYPVRRRSGSRRSWSSAFPCSGGAAYDGVELELRMALEPWLVLGEEATAQRQARCRRFRGGAAAGQVPRARSRAPSSSPATAGACRCDRPASPASSSPPFATRRGSRRSALHPTIGAHAPLVFDVFDRGLGRAIGGCVYHVEPPGGRSYDAVPRQRLRGRGAPDLALLGVGHTAGEAASTAVGEELRAYYAKRPSY